MEQESINYKHRGQKHPRGLNCIQGSINDIRKELSALGEIRRDNRKLMNVKTTRLFKKYNTVKTKEMDQLIEELKQKVSTKTQTII